MTRKRCYFGQKAFLSIACTGIKFKKEILSADERLGWIERIESKGDDILMAERTILLLYYTIRTLHFLQLTFLSPILGEL